MTDNYSGRSADALNFLENASLTREGDVGGKPDFIGIRKRSYHRAVDRYGVWNVLAYQHDKWLKEQLKRAFWSNDNE